MLPLGIKWKHSNTNTYVNMHILHKHTHLLRLACESTGALAFKSRYKHAKSWQQRVTIRPGGAAGKREDAAKVEVLKYESFRVGLKTVHFCRGREKRCQMCLRIYVSEYITHAWQPCVLPLSLWPHVWVGEWDWAPFPGLVWCGVGAHAIGHPLRPT